MKESIKFQYMMLSRLKSDCDYFLGNGEKSSRLWGITIEEHIDAMKDYWNNLKTKPEWLSMEEILEYKKEMTKEIV